MQFETILKFKTKSGDSKHSDYQFICMALFLAMHVCWATNVSRQYRLRTQITLRALLVEPLKFLRHYLFRTHYGVPYTDHYRRMTLKFLTDL